MYKLFVINLDFDKDRFNDVAKKFNDLSIKFERVAAVYGKGFNESELADFTKKYPQIKGPGKLGCFLSHSHIWKKIAEGEQEYGFIFEDDVHFSNDLKKFVESENWMPERFDIIRLEVSTNRLLLAKSNDEFLNRKIHKLKSSSYCAGAYVMSKSCAKKMIAISALDIKGNDKTLFDFEESVIAKSLDIYQVSPALVIQDKYINSEVKLGYESNIESFSGLKKLKWTIKNYSHYLTFGETLKKAILGYKRVVFK
jgi:glycosyl transferase family 25